MKRLLVVVMVVCSFLLVPLAWAHAPLNITMTYDAKAKIVTISIFHPVARPTTHYIKRVVVSLNGTKIADKSFYKQDTDVNQELILPVAQAKSGDRVSIEAYCNVGGSLAKDIEIP